MLEKTAPRHFVRARPRFGRCSTASTRLSPSARLVLDGERHSASKLTVSSRRTACSKDRQGSSNAAATPAPRARCPILEAVLGRALGTGRAWSRDLRFRTGFGGHWGGGSTVVACPVEPARALGQSCSRSVTRRRQEELRARRERGALFARWRRSAGDGLGERRRTALQTF